MTMEPEQQKRARPRKEEDREDRRRRRAVEGASVVGKLAVPPHLLDTAKYEYRWFNDEQNGRIYTKTTQDDWDLVRADGADDETTDLGAMFSRVVGSHKDGSPKRAYLARKPKTYFDEDKAREQSALDEHMAQLGRGNDRTGAAQSDYVPHSGIRL